MHTIFSQSKDFSNTNDLENRTQDSLCPEIDIKVENIKSKCLIDTGSKLTCISEKFYNLHKAQFQKLPTFPLTGIDVTGFNGEKSKKLKIQFTAQV